VRRLGPVLLALLATSAMANGPEEAPKTSGSVTGSFYAMRDQPDFGVGVAALNHGSLRLEARYNYEARNSTSVFAGWKFAGGDSVTYEITPIIGGLFGDASGVIPGIEASVAWRNFDAYIEAEYVRDLDVKDDSYFYMWSELGWRPVEWLRVGFVGQRTRVIDNDRDIQRGVFAQATMGAATISLYAFNPESASRYVIISLGMAF
jgi:hypothetical protein